MFNPIKTKSNQIKEEMISLKKKKKSLRVNVRKDIQYLLNEFNFKVDDFYFVDKPLNKPENVELKYKKPNGKLWSGRGREPLWLKTLIKEGKIKSKEDLLIK